MLDNDDFPAEPEHRASDPSIEEMLRRARDARMDDTPRAAEADAPHLRPFATPESGALRNGWLRDCALLVIGVLIGALVACTAIRVGTLVSNASTLMQPTTPNTSGTTPPAAATTTATPLPTPTDTPAPTPTAVPTATADPSSPSPPTIGEIATLAQDFYDNQSSAAGIYVLVDVTAIQVQSQDETQLTACLVFDVASASSPGTVVEADTRLFTLAPENDGTWLVTEMYYSGSCSLS